MARIVLLTMGSWGDLFPFLGVGVELQRRGHDVTVACSPAFADLATEAGLDAAPVGRPIEFEEFSDRPEIFKPMGLGFRHALDEFLFKQIDDVTADVLTATKGADLLLVHPIHLAAMAVAERENIPAVVATVFPGMIPSTHTVPGGINVGPWTGVVGRAANRALWRAASGLVGVLFDRKVNAHRRQLGLTPARGALFRVPRRHPMVVMAPEALVQRPPDWPSTVEVTSFVAWDQGRHRPVDADTEAFLQAGPPPVLITLGSSNAVQPEDFFDLATQAVVDHGERALVVTGPAPRSSVRESGDAVHVTDFAPFGTVAPRCRAAVHHAGQGTTTAVLRAGIPQVVVPRGLDQPDTAAVLERIGVAVTVPWGKRHARLVHAIDQMLIDTTMAARAAEVAAQIGGVDGAAATADVIERRLGVPTGQGATPSVPCSGTL